MENFTEIGALTCQTVGSPLAHAHTVAITLAFCFQHKRAARSFWSSSSGDQ